MGRAAILLLAGGQGTRLGSDAPKGCYSIGLPSGKCLYQLQAERILSLQRLAAQVHFGAGSPVRHPLRWYIMTSPFTHAATLEHFSAADWYGLQREQVVLFQQGFMPCLSMTGEVILETATKIAKAPDGNGGIYSSMKNSGVLDGMLAAGIECVDCFSVDNVLARIGDPAFLGYCYSQDADWGARVVARAGPEEKVGVFVNLPEGRLGVVEYSELDPETASAPDPHTNGETLMYNWGNICMHYFKTAWLQEVYAQLQQGALPYHPAHKKIPSKDGPVQGVKLELFIFDAFPLAAPGGGVLLEVERSEGFAPVKNARGSATDSPDTARELVLQLHARWVRAAGGAVSSQGVEVSPLVSYAGEGLGALCSGREFMELWDDRLQGAAK